MPGRPERGRNCVQTMPEIRGLGGERLRGLVFGNGKRRILCLLRENRPTSANLGPGSSALHGRVPVREAKWEDGDESVRI